MNNIYVNLMEVIPYQSQFFQPLALFKCSIIYSSEWVLREVISLQLVKASKHAPQVRTGNTQRIVGNI